MRWYFFPIFILFFACSTEGIQKNRSISADFNSPASISISQLGACASIVPIQTSGPIGDIYSIRKYDGYYFLFDKRGRAIWYLDSLNHVNKFDKLGRGPEEYVDIFSFAYNAQDDELIVYDRSKNSINIYTLTDGRLYKKIDLGERYYNAMELSVPGELVLVRQSRKDISESSILVYDYRSERTRELLDIREDQARILTDLSHDSLGKVLFGLCGLSLSLYSYIDGDIDLLCGFNIPADPFWRQYWKRPFSEERFQQLFERTHSGNKRNVTSPSLITMSGGDLSFWYMTGEGISAYHLPDRNCCIVHEGKAQVYNAISCPELGIDRLQPMGSDGRSYISLITADDVTPRAGTELGDAFLSLKEEGIDVALLVYSLF